MTGFTRPLRVIAVAAICAALLVAIITLSDNGWSPGTQASKQAAHAAKADALQVEGTVVSAQGAAIGGASVCGYGVDVANHFDKPCVTAVADGSFKLTLAAGTHSVTASANNYGNRTLTISIRDAAAPARLDFVLERAQPTLVGTVKAATGRSIKQASIEILQGNALIANIATDADGRFAGWAPVGAVQLRVGAPGYRPVQIQSFAPAFDIEVTLYPGYPVQGVVLYESTLQPARGVRVVASTGVSGIVNANDASALSDERGRFVIEGVAPGQIFLNVGSGHLWGRAKTTVAPDSSGEEVRILVVPAAQVSGQFNVSDNDRPCTQGSLQLIAEEIVNSDARNDLSAVYSLEAPSKGATKFVTPPLAARVAGNGQVTLAAVPQGEYRFGPECDQYEFESGPTTLTVRGEDIAGLQWKFTAGPGIAVRVADENGRGVAGAGVAIAAVSGAATQEETASHTAKAAKTDEKGRYRFAGLTEGVYTVVASDPGLGAVQVQRDVAVRQGDEEPVNLVLPVIGAIHIHATTPAGEPVSRLLFHANDANGKRFEAKYVGGGRYELGPLPRGPYSVYAYDNKNPKIAVRGATGEQLLVDGADPVELEFQYQMPQGAIEGIVVDSAGNPATAAIQAVSATLDDNDDYYSSIQTQIQGEQYRITDERGRFRIENVLPGVSYRLFAQGKSGQKVEQGNVAAGQFVQISLPTLGTISGLAVDGNGAALDDFQIVARSVDSGDVRGQEFRAAKGHFTLSNLNPGKLQLLVVSADYRLRGSIDTQLPPGESRSGLRLVATDGADKP